jgi:hypothetical protein
VTTDEPISFEREIKPLFREGDRQSMKPALTSGHTTTWRGTATP